MQSEVENRPKAPSGLNAYLYSMRLDESLLVLGLRAMLDAKLVAYIGSVKETRAVRQWIEGGRNPSGEMMTRLRNLL